MRSIIPNNDLKQKNIAILNLMEKGQLMLKELMMHLSKQLAPSLQENQARKIHFIAKEKLRFFLKVNYLNCFQLL